MKEKYYSRLLLSALVSYLYYKRKNIIRQYADQGWYAECLYLLAMVDYLSRENGLPLCNDYDDLRQMKLKAPLYPFSVVIADAVSNDQQRMKACMQQAIPEFRRFNIIESEVRNVV